MIECINTERSVISVLIQNPDYFRTAKNCGIFPDDFYDPLNRKLYSYICNNPQYDLNSLLDAFPDESNSIMELATFAVTGVRFSDWCATLKEYSGRRKIASEAAKIAKMAELKDSDFKKALSKFQKIGLDVSARMENNEAREMETVIDDYIRKMEDGSLSNEVIKYGLPFDEWLKHERMTIVTLGAVPGGGKTNFALTVFLNLLNANRIPAMFVQEMKVSQLLQRLTSNLAGVRLYDVMARKERLKCREAEEALKRLAEKKRFLLRGAGDYKHSASGISMELKRFSEVSGGVDFIIVDYLQVMQPPPALAKADDVRRIIDYNLEQLKETAAEFNASVLLLSQLSRDGQKGEEPKPSSLKDSSHIEEMSDSILILKRKTEAQQIKDSSPDQVTVYCVKNRNGKLFQMDLWMYGAYCRFSDHVYTEGDCIR